MVSNNNGNFSRVYMLEVLQNADSGNKDGIVTREELSLRKQHLQLIRQLQTPQNGQLGPIGIGGLNAFSSATDPIGKQIQALDLLMTDFEVIDNASNGTTQADQFMGFIEAWKEGTNGVQGITIYDIVKYFPDEVPPPTTTGAAGTTSPGVGNA